MANDNRICVNCCDCMGVHDDAVDASAFGGVVMVSFIATNISCASCLYYSGLYLECNNPASKHYHHHRKRGDICGQWEYRDEFETEPEAGRRTVDRIKRP